ncbi:monovalent cation:proton antiporter family protein [Alteromonas sp. a30]|uniref:monovalent cation:proton antiporter family protein n=1 Tax=Alteromonas sp. a30 TaxID=2730917 RepID=UPI00227FFFF8|nr:monovalent cation:proton antiporter family protein [Alteromonas sp. a30]MCY7294306.1 potassium transporter [Alteromonas sp. a30]
MPGGFVDILILMTVSVAFVWLFKRVHLPPILAYLCCGIVIGPSLVGVYQNPDEMHFMAELGIVFLLFSLGLEFSLPRMISMRHLVFGVGFGQMLTTTLLFMALAMLLGLEAVPALVIGSMLALSSTAIVIKQSSELGILNTSRAQMAVSVLLFQDLAVVPLLIVIPLLADGNDANFIVAIAAAVAKGALVFVILLSTGKWLLPRIFNEVARTRTDELFVLTTILVALIAAGLTYSFGLSMALGAFLAGMMLGESQYRHQLEADIRPFRDILMGLFFITIGMKLDLSVLPDSWYWILSGLVVLVCCKVLMMRLSAWLFNAPVKDSWAAGIKLSQMGEFSFIIAALAVQNHIISNQQSSLLISIGILSMAITPWLIENSGKLALKLSPVRSVDTPSELTSEQEFQDHILIFGFGRVGQSVSRLLKAEGIAYVAVDIDPVRVNESRLAGESVYFGDVRSKDILRTLGLERAKLAILTFDQPNAALNVIESVKAIKADLPIVVRTRKDENLASLYQAGATQVVPEILEGSLMLVSQVLHLSGVPMSRILKRVRKERKSHYRHLHGFFPGESTDMASNRVEKLVFIHAIPLPRDAYAIGKTIEDMGLENMRITVGGLRRDNTEIAEPAGDTVLQANDILVVSGKPRRVERAERRLLEGR